ncbi:MULTISPECIES: DUF4160 domain-containing protein [Methylosinus]|uniref:DUF4160 domain-containing protein n=1 Tax=Methylosinus trichosporium (strain ATCC 35070 / NCIMB 11131 / UNIQEM 75 / OB3b) TaxID=595536 RepID=A0A2D2D2R7_METT3|nr:MULTISPECIES: DUF4160 domain-containing protein [Methylosinus]ATQ69275.1 DUF4160 domain-containing protein [Methylosinus trichosporium OB3b]OBS53241.1 hypothetical protein A8B73_06535 [Methylosinus sp. 3S-1]
MPAVFRQNGYRFFFYSNEGDPREPIHIHVMKDGRTAKFWLEPVGLAQSARFDARALRELEQIVQDRAGDIRRAWREHFG